MSKNSTYLSRYYTDISNGNRRVLNTLKTIAQTARQIDPSCPYGAHGVLGSLSGYGFSSQEMEKFFKLCGNDARIINAVDYCVFKKKLSVDDLKSAVKRNFKSFNLAGYVQFAMRDSHSFSQYYNPKLV